MTDELLVREINYIARGLTIFQRTLLIIMRKNPDMAWGEIYIRAQIFENINQRKELYRELERVERDRAKKNS